MLASDDWDVDVAVSTSGDTDFLVYLSLLDVSNAAPLIVCPHMKNLEGTDQRKLCGLVYQVDDVFSEVIVGCNVWGIFFAFCFGAAFFCRTILFIGFDCQQRG
jgi:hypothetical protein